MAFAIGTNTQKTDAGFVKGKQREIACQCWYTSKGKVTPLMLKIEDEDGRIRTIDRLKCFLRKKGDTPECALWSLTAS